MRTFAEEVETTYDVRSVTANGLQVWPVLRQQFVLQHNWRSWTGLSRDRPNTLTELARAGNVFHGMTRWLKKHDYVVFSTTLMRRLLEGKHIDKSHEWLMREVGKENVLVVEAPVAPGGADFTRTLNPDEYAVSCDLLTMLICLPSLPGTAIKNEGILADINKEYDLNVNYRHSASVFFRMVKVFDWLLRRWQPKALFFTCYYGIIHQAAIFSAWKAGVVTVELQHGRIDNHHPAYNVYCRLDRSSFPDYLLCHSERVREVFRDGNYLISQENVIPIGDGYIEYIRDNCKGSDQLLKTIKNYKTSVAVSSVLLLKDEIMEFVRAAAAMDESVLYVFIRRDSSYDDMILPANVKSFEDLDFYRIVKHTDFHATVCSTTAFEAPALGTPNVLMDINGKARSYFSDTLANTDVTRFARTPREFVDTILDWDTKSREQVMELHREFYQRDHVRCVKEALERILKQ